jgi:hypothetical protein
VKGSASAKPGGLIPDWKTIINTKDKGYPWLPGSIRPSRITSGSTSSSRAPSSKSLGLVVISESDSEDDSNEKDHQHQSKGQVRLSFLNNKTVESYTIIFQISVKIERTDTVSSDSNGIPSAKKQLPGNGMLGVKHLPAEIRDSFSKVFCPRYIELIGLSKEPWLLPSLYVTQQLFNKTYPNYKAQLSSKDAVCDVVSIFYLDLETVY